MTFKKYREELFDYVRRGCEDGLIRISSGNFSLRIDDNLVAITPGGILYRSMKPEEISIVDLQGSLVEGPSPSSETPMHTAIYRQISRIRAICHTHSIYAMVLSQLEEDVPLISIELMVCGAPIPVAPWATPGTDRAGDVTVDIFQARENLKVLLLRKHGLVAVGGSLDEAYNMASAAETGLEVFYKARLLGDVQAFSPEQIKKIGEVYGL
jgi:L-fuculose-phosphate aldolase